MRLVDTLEFKTFGDKGVDIILQSLLGWSTLTALLLYSMMNLITVRVRTSWTTL